MIVRDEERHLDRCLASLDGVVDEVVIIDTGSTDDSIAIARARGARVHQSAWEGDFSRSRNIALALARGRWILYIDADEELAGASRESVEGLLSAAQEAAFRLLLHPYPGWTAYREFRLWRNNPRVRFEGVIHEKVRPAILDLAEREERPIGDCDLRLLHDGYVGDQERKHRRNLPLLRAELAQRPHTVFNWRHLAVALAALGERVEAERALERAVALAPLATPGDVHGSLAFSELVRMRHRRGANVDELLLEGLERWPENWLLVWIAARVGMTAGRHDAALERLDRLAAVELDGLAELGVAYDSRLFGVFANAARGRCLLELQRPAEAAVAYAAAARCEPGSREYEVKRELALARARRGVKSPSAPFPLESARAPRRS